MSRASVLARSRRAARAGFHDTCIITRAGAGDPVFDESTGQYTDPPRVTVYSGPCRFQTKSVITGSSEVYAGERQVTTQEIELQLPVADTEAVSVHDVVTAVTAVYDASLVDRVFTIKARHEKSDATARRLRVVEVTG